nr:pif3 [Calliteara abietis nucleopolyhedrovirus]
MSQNRHFAGLLILLSVLIVLCALCLRQGARFIDAIADQIDADGGGGGGGDNTQTNALQFLFEQNGIVDCNVTKLPCVTDRQCADNCSMQHMIDALVCVEGFCSSRAAAAGGQTDDFDCDAALGLIKVFVASEFVTQQICISTYRELVDDEGHRRPYVCDSGVFDIDLARRQFTVEDCTCAPGYTKMVFNQGALARSVPVCIPDATVGVYGRVYV